MRPTGDCPISVPPQPYPLGGSSGEQSRLLDQARGYLPLASRLLDDIVVRPGWRAVDVGCGPIGILDLLAERIGPRGYAVGLEREPRFAAMARREVARRGLSNVKILEADIFDHSLEKGSFDLVHERLLMINVAAREALLSEMISLLRPGGIVVLQDIDNVSWLCQPPSASWAVLRETFFAVHRASGGDPFIGRRLPGYLGAAGIEDVQVKVHADAAMPGDFRRTRILTLIESVRGQLLAMGLLTETQLDEHVAATRKHLEDPQTIVIDKLLVQSWGRKPA